MLSRGNFRLTWELKLLKCMIPSSRCCQAGTGDSSIASNVVQQVGDCNGGDGEWSHRIWGQRQCSWRSWIYNNECKTASVSWTHKSNVPFGTLDGGLDLLVRILMRQLLCWISFWMLGWRLLDALGVGEFPRNMKFIGKWKTCSKCFDNAVVDLRRCWGVGWSCLDVFTKTHALAICR